MSRIDYFKKKPEFITELRNITKQQAGFSLDSALRAIVELCVSQINGCVVERAAELLRGHPEERRRRLARLNSQNRAVIG